MASELASETAEPLVPSVTVGLKSLPLLSIALLAGGLTVASPFASPVVMSYNTLVLGRPAGLATDIGEALQIGRLHWASMLRQKIDDYRTLDENWDGERALRPTEHTLQAARKVFESLVGSAIRSEIRSAPTTVPLPDGAVRFEWAVGNRELFLTVLEGKVEAQRWEPRDSIDSIYYAELSPQQVETELEWLRA